MASYLYNKDESGGLEYFHINIISISLSAFLQQYVYKSTCITPEDSQIFILVTIFLKYYFPLNKTQEILLSTPKVQLQH